MPSLLRSVSFVAFSSVLISFLSVFASPQRYTKADREYAQQMLRSIAGDVHKYYYDAKFHGVDWDGRVLEARKNIDAADSLESAVAEIAALLDRLNDSHTTFLPPPRTYLHEYGFMLQMIGDRCFVTRVLQSSDAKKKGLDAGNQVLAINDNPVSRKTLWRIEYVYNQLRPQETLRLTLADERSGQRTLDVAAAFRVSPVIKYVRQQGTNEYLRQLGDERRLMRARYFEKGEQLLVVKIPEFSFSALEVDEIVDQMRKHQGVVLDLRGNHGGFTDTLDRLLGGIFEYDRKICDRVRRNSTEPMVAAGRHHQAFIGRFAILIDSESASASEIFARVVQLEKRGFVVGDQSAGMVMESKVYLHEVTVNSRVQYGVSITDADLLMTDGKSLERVGVEPDVLVLPTARDLANKNDPAMAKAATLVGAQLSPDEAGTAFPFEGKFLMNLQ
jgi:C-terminal processing protease CtpA/Prc